MQRDKVVVMADVAKLAGVSHQTVSRVLNSHPSVRPATRQRVLDAVVELEYRPNSAARALASRRSRVIGVLAVEAPRVGPLNTLFAVERAARDAGYFVSIGAVESSSGQDVGAALDRLALQGVEGIVAIAPFAAVFEEVERRVGKIPVVAVEAKGSASLTSVRIDQEAGASAVTSHLIEQGATSVLHLAGPADWWEAGARISGWQRALVEAGMDPPACLTGDWSAASGYVEGHEIASRLPDGSAVFAANDQMALGLLRAFEEQGRRVPEDIMVAGFDDIPESGYFSPPLTTVAQDFDVVGRHGIELLLNEIAVGRHTASSVVVPARLIVRKSSRPSEGGTDST